jgi:hypothetical protein
VRTTLALLKELARDGQVTDVTRARGQGALPPHT